MDPTPNLNRRRGQTLVEFGLVLPILLIMVFGIIEFGRLFQSWVSLQNAARAAARYASTGNINYELFAVAADPSDARPLDVRVLEQIVPCDLNTNGPDIGIKETINGVETYDGNDGLFATWYDGVDCDPSNEEHEQLRKDLLRLVSIMNEARESVNALSVESRTDQYHYYEQLDHEGVKNLLYGIWKNPMDRELDTSWYNVMICSSRGLLNPAARALNGSYAQSRFVTVRSASEATPGAPEYPMPYCMINEIPPAPNDGEPDMALNHAGLRWLDAGGAGERVTIAVTFNHPLITPLRTGAENFIQMQARRSIVNESFRAPKAIGSFQRSLPTGSSGNSGALVSPTPSASPNPTNTPEDTVAPTNTPTNTPEPFKCENLEVSWGSPPFNGDIMYLLINNYNFEQVELTRFLLIWDDLPGEHNKMYLGYAAMYGDIHWSSTSSAEPPMGQSDPNKGSNNTKVNGETIVDSGDMRGGAGYRIVQAQGDAVWEGRFFSGPSNLVEYMSLYDYDAEFTFVGGTPEQTCKIVLTAPDEGEVEDPPTATIGPSPSPTPNCVTATNKVKFTFGNFETNGGVYFNFQNNSGRDLIMTGFKFYWPDRTHPDIVSEPPAGYRLTRVILGGESVLDGTGQRVWQGDIAKGNTKNTLPWNNPTFGGDTNGQGAPVGQWIADGVLKPGTTKIWLDFDAFVGKLSNFGAAKWHFDQAKLYFSCRGGGGNGGGGDEDDGEISVPIPSPTITNTPKPTKTTGPTNTPGKATPVWTATPPKTQPPATLTYTPEPPTLTPSRTPLGVKTPPPAGGGE